MRGGSRPFRSLSNGPAPLPLEPDPHHRFIARSYGCDAEYVYDGRRGYRMDIVKPLPTSLERLRRSQGRRQKQCSAANRADGDQATGTDLERRTTLVGDA